MKFVEIPKCENLFPCGVFVFIAFICVILLFSNAFGESINVIGLDNFTVPENLSKTTKNHILVQNLIDSNITNKLTEKFVAQIKQIDEKKALIKVIPVSVEKSLKNDYKSPKSKLLSLDRNDTVKSTNTTEVLPPPPIVRYIENEGEQLKTINFVSKNSNINTSEEEEDDESSRNTSEEEEDDESSRNTSEEEEDDESSRNTSEEEEDDESSRNTSEEEEDDESSRNTSEEEEDDESSRNTSEEEEDDESSRNTSEEEEDDESSRNTSEEEEDDESSRNTSEEEEDDESSRNTSEEEEDDESSRNTSEEEEDDESSRNTSEEEEDDESSRNTSEEEEDDESSRNTSEEEEDDESSRNTSEEEEDDESSRNTSEEEEDDESSRNTSEEEEDDESSRNTSEEEEDDESSRNTSEEEEDDESSRNTSEEEEDDESSRNTSEEDTSEFYYKKPNVQSPNELTGNKITGNSIDNENNKLMSQFSELNSSIISNMQINAEDDDSKINDKKPIANAGLDQVIKGDQNIVLDASSSFDPEGKISSYLWKQTGNSEDNINTSHSKIYSFPIPEGMEENILEFKLVVMDENGQKDIDTVKYLITDEDNEETET